jgi:SAM-dependent methyltransferase
MTQLDRSGAAEFQDDAVVAAYVHRPPYPEALLARLLELMPARRAVLDLGCGPGKIARALAPHVREVLAVDPSAAMLRLGQGLGSIAGNNIRWVHAAAEEAPLGDEAFDLAVAGAAIHWMDPAAVFPKLARALRPAARLALVDGDAPSESPWQSAYQQVIKAWVERLGRTWDDTAHRALVQAHKPWFDVDGEESFTAPVRQPLEDLIAGEHSRATWSPARLGPPRAAAFDADLRAALSPWADDTGAVAYEVRSRLVWGRPRLSPRAAF